MSAENGKKQDSLRKGLGRGLKSAVLSAAESATDVIEEDSGSSSTQVRTAPAGVPGSAAPVFVSTRRRAPPSRRVPLAEAAPAPESETPKKTVVEGPPKTSVKKERISPVEALAAFAKRPGFCRVGRRVTILTNHFELALPDKPLLIHQYDVTIKHDVIKLTVNEKRDIFWYCVSHQREIFLNPTALAYDGGQILFTREKLLFPNKTDQFIFNIDCVIQRDDQTLNFTVIIKYVGNLELNLRDPLTRMAPQYALPPVQVLDVIIRQYRQITSQYPGRHFLTLQSKVYSIPQNISEYDCGYGKEIWPGLHHSVHLGQEFRPFLNADVKYGVFFKQKYAQIVNNAQNFVDYDVVELILDVLNSHSRPSNRPPASVDSTAPIFRREQMNVNTSLNGAQFEVLNRELKNCFIHTTHMDVNRRRKILGLGEKDALTQTFRRQTGDEISIAQYFIERYNRRLLYPRLPLLRLKGRGQNIDFLPLEVCHVEKKQRFGRRLHDTQTTQVIRTATRGGAPDRYERTYKLLNDGQFHRDPFMAGFDVKIETRMQEVPAYVLPKPDIHASLGQKSTTNLSLNAQNSYIFQNEQFLTPCTINGICIISQIDRRDDRTVRNFTRSIVDYMKARGCQFPSNIVEFVQLNDTSTNELKSGVREAEMRMNNNGAPLLTPEKTPNGIIFVFLRFKNSEAYNVLKHTAEIENGFLTQVILKQTMEKRDAVSNIALKVNLKMLGTNIQLNTEQYGKRYLIDSKTLLVGIDVSHPGPTDTHSPSIGAVVTNTDFTYGQYAGTVRVQNYRREMLVYMKDEFAKRLTHYVDKNNVRPERIIVYRDGVSDSDFYITLREELAGIRTACKYLDAGYKPRITFIVVNKRHNTRMYPGQNCQAVGRSKNVEPGVVVDDVVTSPFMFDFYLCSHYGIQGTSKPAKYTVLHDDNDFSADALQILTYYTTFLYQRCSKSVSLPAPLYFAHLACERARSHLNGYLCSDGSRSLETASQASSVESRALSEEEMKRQTQVAESLQHLMYFT